MASFNAHFELHTIDAYGPCHGDLNGPQISLIVRPIWRHSCIRWGGYTLQLVKHPFIVIVTALMMNCEAVSLSNFHNHIYVSICRYWVLKHTRKGKALSSDIISYPWPATECCRTSFAGDLIRIQDDIVYVEFQPESKGSRTSSACGFYPIPDDVRVCLDSLSLALSLALSFSLSLFLSLSLYKYIRLYTNRYIIIYTNWTRQLNIGSFVGVFVQHRPMTTTTIRQGEDSCMNLWNC